MRLTLLTILVVLIGVSFADKYCPNSNCPLYKVKISLEDSNYCEDCGTKLRKWPPPLPTLPISPPPPEEPAKPLEQVLLPRPTHEESQTKIVGPGLKLINIPGGTFDMGSIVGDQDEKPVHPVMVESFWLGETEVTIGQFVAFLNEKQPNQFEIKQLIAFNSLTHITRSGSKFYAEGGWDNNPVVNVSWFGANMFCKYYGLRLPTEAEWEYAAGGPNHYKYPWGDEFDEKGCCFEKYQGGGQPPTVRVKCFKPNGYGLYDIVGNVWEWCNDWYEANYYARKLSQNPQGASNGSYKVMRGGSYNFPASTLRVSNRFMYYPDFCFDGRGFRVAGN